MPLSDAKVKNAKPKDKAYKLADSGGLYLQVTPSGGKLWRVAYRYNRKQRTHAIGKYPIFSLLEAREARDGLKKLLALGEDPALVKKLEKAAKIEQTENTFKAVTIEWHTARKHRWSKSHAERNLGMCSNNLFPFLGDLPIGSITAPLLLKCLRKVEARGSLYSAHRTLQLSGQVFAYAIATGRADRNPAHDLKGALPPASSNHLAAITEPEEVGKLLIALDQYKGTEVVRAALKLAPLFFVRPGELRHAEWNEIDWKNAEWRIPAEKMKMREPHIVPLCTQAIEVLENLHPITQRSKYVFPSERSAKRPMSENAVLYAMRNMGIDNKTMTGHGFRAMARTILDEVLGVRPDFIEHQLAHAVRDANGRAYNRTSHLPARKKMMQQWADYLDTLRVQALNGNVIPINQKTS
ncbi:MAG: integrase arm-type DNA-binding domain-containing protein [Pseudomonadota bacterium]